MWARSRPSALWTNLTKPQAKDLIARLKAAGVNMDSTVQKVDDRFAGMTFVLTGTLTRFDRKTAENEIVLRGGKAQAAPCRKRPPMWWLARLRAAS